MTARVCAVCGQELPSWARIDKTTCGSACRSRLSRMRTVSCNTFATPSAAVTPRSGTGEGREPVRVPMASLGASGEADRKPSSPMDKESGLGPGRGHDPLVLALARYVASLHRRYPDGPAQMRGYVPNTGHAMAVNE